MAETEFDDRWEEVQAWCRDNLEPGQWRAVDDEWIVIETELFASAFRLVWC
jgi:hypothetical protein